MTEVAELRRRRLLKAINQMRECPASECRTLRIAHFHGRYHLHQVFLCSAAYGVKTDTDVARRLPTTAIERELT